VCCKLLGYACGEKGKGEKKKKGKGKKRGGHGREKNKKKNDLTSFFDPVRGERKRKKKKGEGEMNYKGLLQHQITKK